MLTALVVSSAFAADTTPVSAKFIAPEVAKGTLSCKAQWNEFCEDQKNIQVPAGHKFCQETVTVSEKTGNSSYETVAKDDKGITLKFSAKGNNDRFKQQGASITLNITLQGVHDTDSCDGPKPKAETALTQTTLTTTQLQTQIKTVPAPAPEAVKAAKPAALTPPPAASNETTEKTITASPTEKKLHACACSQWLQADMVYNCLVKGHGRDNVSCDTLSTTIQCVASKEACHEIQTENCEQVLGINQSTSRKRIFVPDSLYCQQQLAK